MSNTTPTPSFDQWLQAVDLAVSAIAGVSVHDLADQPFRDWYDDEMSPQEAARTMLEEEGFPFDDDEFDADEYLTEDELFNGFDLDGEVETDTPTPRYTADLEDMCREDGSYPADAGVDFDWEHLWE